MRSVLSITLRVTKHLMGLPTRNGTPFHTCFGGIPYTVVHVTTTSPCHKCKKELNPTARNDLCRVTWPGVSSAIFQLHGGTSQQTLSRDLERLFSAKREAESGSKQTTPRFCDPYLLTPLFITLITHIK